MTDGRPTTRLRRFTSPAWALFACVFLFGCSRSGPRAIPKLRDALASGDPAATKVLSSLPPCTPPSGGAGADNADAACLSDITRFYGGTQGFLRASPDQASAAAVAAVLTREGHGEWISAADTWAKGLAGGVGPAADALRLAVARAMVAAAPAVGRNVESEDEGRAFLRAVASAIPGACLTYRFVADGRDEATLAPELSPDHAPCVQRDLARREGPGAGYGVGLWRAAAGALALWTEEERALRRGLANVQSPESKAALEAALGTVESATRACKLHRSAPRVNEAWERLMQESHGTAFGASPPPELGSARPPAPPR